MESTIIYQSTPVQSSHAKLATQVTTYDASLGGLTISAVHHTDNIVVAPSQDAIAQTDTVR